MERRTRLVIERIIIFVAFVLALVVLMLALFGQLP
jgi:hypothetical protein